MSWLSEAPHSSGEVLLGVPQAPAGKMTTFLKTPPWGPIPSAAAQARAVRSLPALITCPLPRGEVSFTVLSAVLFEDEYISESVLGIVLTGKLHMPTERETRPGERQSREEWGEWGLPLREDGPSVLFAAGLEFSLGGRSCQGSCFASPRNRGGLGSAGRSRWEGCWGEDQGKWV